MYSDQHFTNREISWLSFNERVLQEAEDPNTPLFERIRFIGIFSNNLDEFFRVRVAAVRRMVDLGKDEENLLGNYTPKELHDKIHEIVSSQDVNIFVIHGFRGIGKTQVAVSIANMALENYRSSIFMESRFEKVFFRRLLKAPTVEDFLLDLLGFFTKDEVIVYPSKLTKMLELASFFLNKYRSLVVIDNFETILDQHTKSGYLQGQDNWGELLRFVGEQKHKSCFLLTTRSLPPEIVQQLHEYSSVILFELR